MLKCKFKDIIYNQRTVLKCNSLDANFGQLTVITGESGSGKSTLFNAMIFENDWLCSYVVNGTSLLELPFGDRSAFLYHHFSIVHQEPLLINNLTIQEHIDMIEKLFSLDVDVKRYIEMLDLNDCINKFPQQLSGGEQTRVSLVLALMKEADIYIFDEPTSSLDDEHAHIVVELFKELKKKNKIILIFTHDKLIIENADKHYHIQDKELHIKKTVELSSETIALRLEHHKNLKSVQGIFADIKKHQKLYRILISMFVTLSIGIVAFAYSFNNFVYDRQQEQLEQIQSNELLVFKPAAHAIFKNNETAFTYGLEEPFTKQDQERVLNIDHVKDIEWKYYSMEPNYRLNEDLLQVPYNSDDPSLKEYRVSIIEGNQTQKTINIADGDDVIVSTYLKDRKNKKDIDIDFHNDGVYISNQLAKRIAGELGISIESLNGKSMKFDLSIPIYNTFGRWQGITEDNEQIFIYNVTVVHESVTLPIAGVLEWSSFGTTDYFAQTMYVERSVFEPFIEKYKRDESRKLYVIGEDYGKAFLNECPEEYKDQVARVFEDEPWTPTAYSVYVDGIENLNKVSEEIEKLGLSVMSGYVESEMIGMGISSMRSAILQGAIVLTVIACLGAIILEYSNQRNEKKMRKYFYQLGLSRDEVKILNQRRYLRNAFKEIIRVIFVMLMLLVFMNSITMTLTVPSVISLVIIIAASFFIHYLVPMFFLERS